MENKLNNTNILQRQHTKGEWIKYSLVTLGLISIPAAVAGYLLHDPVQRALTPQEVHATGNAKDTGHTNQPHTLTLVSEWETVKNATTYESNGDGYDTAYRHTVDVFYNNETKTYCTAAFDDDTLSNADAVSLQCSPVNANK